MPPADLLTLQHIDRKANPIRHYRIGNDCSCEIIEKLPYKEPSLINDTYTKDYCPANSALKKLEIQVEVHQCKQKVILSI